MFPDSLQTLQVKLSHNNYTVVFPNKHPGPSGRDKQKAVTIRKAPPPHIFPNKHPLVKIEREKTETLFPNKLKTPKRGRAPPPKVRNFGKGPGAY